MALVQGRRVAAPSDDRGAAGDALLVTRAERERSRGQVRGGGAARGCGVRCSMVGSCVRMRTGDEGRGCG